MVPDERVPRVAVCVLTFRRPEGLAILLEELNGLQFSKEAEPEIDVVVVDNDPEETAREVCERLEATSRRPILYRPEPARGISFARNRAVEVAKEGHDFIAFIDDDEVPEPVWLDELLHVRRRFEADIVLGPTLRRFEGAVPEWIARGEFFRDDRRETGTRLEHGGIGNSLIGVWAFPEGEPAFDPRLALTGGEDTHFFLRAVRAGSRMVWADDAVVYERLPESRATARWLLQRTYRKANTWSWCERELSLTPRVLAVRVAKGLTRIGMGLAMLPLGAVMGRHMWVKGLQQVCHGAGNLTGLLGMRFREYRVTHGR